MRYCEVCHANNFFWISVVNSIIGSTIEKESFISFFKSINRFPLGNLFSLTHPIHHFHTRPILLSRSISQLAHTTLLPISSSNMNPHLATRNSSCLSCQNNASRASFAGNSSRQSFQGGSSFNPPMQSNRGSTYGGGYNPPRAQPVFRSASSGNFYSPQQTGYPGRSYGSVRYGSRTMQNSGRSNQYNRQASNTNFQSAYNQTQQSSRAQSRQNVGPQYCTPQAIKINITADQLQNAKNTPIFQDRGEPNGTSDQGGNGMKYIQLNWQDLLGGMENLRVSMAPCSSDPNANRQLKVSFGGQKTDPPQAGETPLKVISIQPASTTERMELGKGNAYAGSMKVCQPPTSMRMIPTSASQTNYRRNGGSCRGTCRR